MPEPDGVGLSLEDVRALLAAKHGATLSADDPVLMLVTLQNAFLAEYERLLARHNQALTTLLAEKTEAHVSGVLQAAESLRANLSTGSVEAVRAVLAGHVTAMTHFRAQLIWLAAVVALSALCNVAVFALRGIS